MRSRQRGVSMIFIAIIAVIVAAAVLAFLALTRTSSGVDRSTETTARLARISDALERFASSAERLPCPANPALDTGDAEPNTPTTPTTGCTHATSGTIPWRTLGLRRDDSLDAWGWKISYRVYAGPTGLTQDKGASMVNCDTNDPTPAGVDATGRCRVTQNTTPDQYLAGKGLTITDFGTPVNNAAFVLISHGPTGVGAHATSGTANMPGPSSADESANLANGPYVAKAASTGVGSTTATHF